MPELPEVETVKNQIAPYIIGRTITKVTLLWDRMVKGQDPQDFVKRIAGQKITDVTRHGKYLIVHLGSGHKMIIHLKMTGSLILGNNNDTEPPLYSRAVIHLDDGQNIYFRDPRKFGILNLVKDTLEIDAKLGPEPLEAAFTLPIFTEGLLKRSAPVKSVILDQKFIAGVGNMYADEALFLAKIDPRRPANKLKKAEIKRLYAAIQDVLIAGIKYGGASVVTYYHPDGSVGTAHQHFNVAHNLTKECPVCGGPVKRIVVGGRGTYYCPKCQK
jgi:formamidopyrimidine-DNA glycosylase